MPTEASLKAAEILRDAGQFKWHVIPLLALVVYVYSVEIERKNWNLVFAGLAFWGMDWLNEIWNALVFHFTRYAAVWAAPGQTAYLLLIGLNIEICLMFAIAGVVFCKTLPAERSRKVFGVPNRLFMALAGSVLCVLVEMLLNAAGALTWDYRWWNARAPWLIIAVGYLPFFLVAFWVHDMPTLKKKAATVGTILLADGLGLLIFGPILGWI